MNYRRVIAGALAFVMAACAAGCGKKDSGKNDSKENTTAATTEEVTTEEATKGKEQPMPTVPTDPNAITFDDGKFDFAFEKGDDPDCAKGTLSVEELLGNKMLKFADDNTVPLSGKVQKIGISVAKLLGYEGAARVRRIEFDMYAKATADHLKTDDADGVRAPGWIGGGGGTVTAKDDKWYDFQEFSGGEYDFETSGPVHAVFKFLLADSGQCWTEDMDDPNFLIMRWGIANESDMYIDNIIFYDEEGQSIPIDKDAGSKVKERLEKAAEKVVDEAEKVKDEVKDEVGKAKTEVKDEVGKAKDEIKEEVGKAQSEAEKDIGKSIDTAQQELDKINKQAQEAIAEANRLIEEGKKK
ncbi:hypothetical protein [Ruminococcus flavefaciens]|uniref:hypothetical protein n=1 Tax=Ruminococcus flavefaciens TaxID=1265 RepID=UPI0002DE5265|nr:hypothetical protein [Ruminococcus flavefaciens]